MQTKIRNKSRIITDNIYPPIPDRSHDWSAHYPDYEPGDPIGYGATEQEAIDDLVENYEDPHLNPFDPDRLREDRADRY